MQGSILRCKMRVDRVTHEMNPDGTVSQEQVELRAVYAEKGPNTEWSKWTPSADFKIAINNTSAFNKLSKGHEFYVDFTPVEKEEEKVII